MVGCSMEQPYIYQHLNTLFQPNFAAKLANSPGTAKPEAASPTPHPALQTPRTHRLYGPYGLY